MYCAGSEDETRAQNRSQIWAYVSHGQPLSSTLVAPVSIAAAATVSSIPFLALWHARLGHASSFQVQQLASRGLLGSVSTEIFYCVSFHLKKQLALPFNTSESIFTDIFDLIHSDVWRSSSVSSIGGSRYFVVFVNDYSRYNWIFHMKHRFELLQVYSNFAKMVETQFSKRIKIFRSDNALEPSHIDDTNCCCDE